MKAVAPCASWMAMMIELRIVGPQPPPLLGSCRFRKHSRPKVAHLLPTTQSVRARRPTHGLAADATLSTAAINDSGSSCTGSTVIHTTIKKAAAAAILNLSTSAEAANASVAPIVRSARLTTISPAP